MRGIGGPSTPHGDPSPTSPLASIYHRHRPLTSLHSNPSLLIPFPNSVSLKPVTRRGSSFPMDLTIQPHRSPNFAPYQKELFELSQHGSKPPFNTHPDELEAHAKIALSRGGWLYASCNAGVGWTSRANREGGLPLESWLIELMGVMGSAFYR